ncbi:GtrA family protein [Longirhabdus pacifica]|uniref:GtrA family protein n=1 Tax=Longirhabdus pacifica TaxID=2305227 RepID=UPI0013E8F079|nr:GtrA family protein [Longirhabdus pacifica]
MFILAKMLSKQGIKFALVGVMNTVVDFIIFFILYERFQYPFIVSQIVAYSGGMVHSYFLNKHFTFQSKRKSNVGEWMKFIVVNSCSLLLSLGLLQSVMFISNGNMLVSKAIATIGAMSINFIASKVWVFKS